MATKKAVENGNFPHLGRVWSDAGIRKIFNGLLIVCGQKINFRAHLLP
ncbi:hypothetical protein [Acetobacter aceti]|nr:hypothetical protein [Acetobacter aceti]